MSILAKNLMILASAGSGKTFQLGNRVIGLVARGTDPAEIVALTFTRKAAGEFADSVLTKLSEAACKDTTATRLREVLDLPDADFSATLERVVRALPRFTLGTMDSFFARIVRGFQYELGLSGGTFDLVEGPRAAALADELLAAVLGDTLTSGEGNEFFHAFRRASAGRESQGVLKPLRDYVNRWQARYQENAGLDWGPRNLTSEAPEAWEQHKAQLAATARDHLDGIDYTHSSQPAALEKCIDLIEAHTIGSGSLGVSSPKLLADILEAVATDSVLAVKSYKDFVIDGPCGAALREMVELAARCELGAAVLRTRAIRDVVAVYDSLCEKRLRKRGLLGFHDVKLLMGRWARDENARLRREAVDFRLDSVIRHWLLDEFQDTSRADWLGLLPLVDEAATADDGTMFIVGDKKQAIYAWRGGDVRLFDEVSDRYRNGLDTFHMSESWRSCPEVLALVNRVCGDLPTMNRLFGRVASRWEWQDHTPAAPLLSRQKNGESRVEVVGKWEERLERLAGLLSELGVGQKAMTCGVLLRGNEKARETAEFLRTHGFDVIEEGRRQPAADNPVGIAISHFIQWLADPADRFSRGVLAMSPLGSRILEAGGGYWNNAWEHYSQQVASLGFAPTVENLVSGHWAQWSDFGKRRAGDMLAALEAVDHERITSAREAADWLRRLELSQSPGIAAVQVMTIHKSKGLGFDVVVLPEIPADPLPQAQYFDIAESDNWITETPPKWARRIIPEIRAAEERWEDAQRYEGFCTLYVALTRAKRGLYVLLEPPAKTADPDKPSLANWLHQSLGAGGETGIVHQAGSPGWTTNVPEFESAATPETPKHPGPAIPPKTRGTPTGAKDPSRSPAHSRTGMAFGNEVHSILETVRWIDEAPLPPLPANAAGKAVAHLIQHPGMAELFSRGKREIELLTEQPIDHLTDDGVHVSGVIDRLHLHRDRSGRINALHLIDYKTDAVADPAELEQRYAGQMKSYATILRRIHPGCELTCTLVSIRHAARIEIAV